MAPSITFYINMKNSELYSEPTQKSKTNLDGKTVNV